MAAESESGVEESRDLEGIPPGNTVAVVGDPGTGKTTFLLSYFRFGKRSEAGIVLQPEPPIDPEPAKALNRLVSPAKRKDAQPPLPAETAPILRCFISLESSFERMRRISQALQEMPPESAAPAGPDNDSSPVAIENGAETQTDASAPPSGDDVFVFVDATAFLSGRLEDRLRYPRLEGRDDGAKPSYRWRRTALSLGGFGADERDSFGLYWQDVGDKPVRIEQLSDPSGRQRKAAARTDWDKARSPEGNAHPFYEPSEEARKTYRVYDLLTRPLPDPLQRVRLLKDLLAELFVRFEWCKNRIVAIDSLNALTSRLELMDIEGGAETHRLHILNLVRWLEEYNVTTFLACEASAAADQTLARQPLFLDTEARFLVSGVIQLNYHRYPSGDLARYLRILKMRGASHDMRPYGYGLDKDGIAWVVPMFGEEQTGVRQ